MDYFAHGAWSYIIFRNWRAVLFGLLPDSMSWLIFFFYQLFNGNFCSGAPVVENLPGWIFLLYDISHSLIVAFVVIGLVYFIFKKLFIFSSLNPASPLKIICDISPINFSDIPPPKFA